MTETGIRRILTTPHIQGSLTLDRDRYEARLATVGAAFAEARIAVAERFPDVEFRKGHEVLIDIPEVDCSDVRIRMAGTTFVLIEWPRLQVPPGTPRVIEGIRQQGYRPIVAHPERYIGMSRSLPLASKWREAGAYLQVNYGSLLGRYGAEARTVAYELLRQGWVDYLASDFHGHRTLKIYQSEAWEELEQRDGGEIAELLSRANPARLLEDLEPMYVPPLPPDRSFLRRLGRLLGGDKE